LKRAANRATRRIRTGSLRKGIAHVPQHALPQVFLAAEGIDQLAASSLAIALMVEIAPAKVLSSVTSGRGVHGEAFVAAAALRSVRASAYSSLVDGCRKTGKSLPTG